MKHYLCDPLIRWTNLMKRSQQMQTFQQLGSQQALLWTIPLYLTSMYIHELQLCRGCGHLATAVQGLRPLGYSCAGATATWLQLCRGYDHLTTAVHAAYELVMSASLLLVLCIHHSPVLICATSSPPLQTELVQDQWLVQCKMSCYKGLYSSVCVCVCVCVCVFVCVCV